MDLHDGLDLRRPPNIWELGDLGRPNELLTVGDHTAAVDAIAISGAGRRIVTADSTGRQVPAVPYQVTCR